MPFSDEDIGAVMAQYQGVDRQQLVDCGERIKEKLGEDAEKHGDLKILSKAATKLMGAKTRTAQVEQAAEAEADAEAQETESVSLAPMDDYVPTSVVEAQEYITAANTIDPKRDFYRGVQGQTLTKTGLDKLARCAQINTEVVDVQVTSEMILAKVRGWIGPRDNPLMETMDVADYSIRDKSTEFVIEKLNKKQVEAKDIVEDGDALMFVNPVHNIRMKAFLIKEKEFALRATVSKAENRVKRKLLGLNSMDLKEAQMLKEEFERVNGRVQRRLN